MPPHVRRATLQDAALVATLNAPVQRLHAANRPQLFKPPSSTPELTQHYAACITAPDTTVYVAEVDGVAVGYAVCAVVSRPENPFTYAHDVLLVDDLSVSEAQQGQGCGTALLNAAFEQARRQGIPRVVVNVWDFNDHALQFYLKRGFRTYNLRLEAWIDE